MGYKKINNLARSAIAIFTLWGCNGDSQLAPETSNVQRLGSANGIRWGTATITDSEGQWNIGTGKMLYSLAATNNSGGITGYLYGDYSDVSPQVYFANLVKDVKETACVYLKYSASQTYQVFPSFSELKDVSSFDFETTQSINFGTKVAPDKTYYDDCYRGLLVFQETCTV